MFRTLYVFIIIHILRGCPEIIPRVYLNPSDTGPWPLNFASTGDTLKPLNEHDVLANIIRYWPIVVIPIAYFVLPISLTFKTPTFTDFPLYSDLWYNGGRDFETDSIKTSPPVVNDNH
ncbi:hypothetical protein SprV_0200644100 [Sparganum proliferum]